MSTKRIRHELDALRNQLTGPAAARQPSALEVLEERLNRLADRMEEAGQPGKPSPEAMAELSDFWRTKFGKELRP